MPTTAQRDRRYERIFTEGREIDVRHFYSISSMDDVNRDGYEKFAYGYFTSDGIFCTGVAHYDGEEFSYPLEQPPVR